MQNPGTIYGYARPRDYVMSRPPPRTKPGQVRRLEAGGAADKWRSLAVPP